MDEETSNNEEKKREIDPWMLPPESENPDEAQLCDTCWLEGYMSWKFHFDNFICRRCFGISLRQRMKETNGN